MDTGTSIDHEHLLVSPAAGAYLTVQDSAIDPAAVYAAQRRLAAWHRKLAAAPPDDPRTRELHEKAAALQAKILRAHRKLGGTVYRIASFHRSTLVKRAKQLTVRTKRTGSAPIEVHLLGHAHMAPAPGYESATLQPATRLAEYEWVAISGPAPRAAGYEIVARLEPMLDVDPPTQRIRRMPNLTPPAAALNIESFRGRPQYCEHCSTLRKRKYTYLVYGEKDASLMQIGRSCLADYTGAALPESMLKHAEALHELVVDIQRQSGPYELPAHQIKTGYRVDDFLAACAAIVRVEGAYRTRASLALYERDMATAPRAWEMVKALLDPKTPVDQRPAPATTHDRQLAEQVLSFASSFDDGSEYAATLRSLSSLPYIPRSEAGTLGSAFALYQDSLVDEAEPEPRLDEHYGIVGERYPFTLQVMRSIQLESDRGGYFWLYVLLDAERRHYRLSRSRQDLDVGGTYSLTADVKDHDVSEDYGNVTVLGNPRSIRLVEDK